MRNKRQDLRPEKQGTISKTVFQVFSLSNVFSLTSCFSGLVSSIVLMSLLQISCKEEDHKKKIQLYEGPVSELDGINMTYSDSARLVVRMVTEKQLTMSNDDRVYPKEVKIYFYDRLGNETTNLRGDSARYFRSSNLYKVYRHVVINNALKGETLKTDELTWNPDQKKVYTDKPVDVYTREEVLHGVGMDANQDFTQYTLRKVTGVVSVKNLPQ